MAGTFGLESDIQRAGASLVTSPGSPLSLRASSVASTATLPGELCSSDSDEGTHHHNLPVDTDRLIPSSIEKRSHLNVPADVIPLHNLDRAEPLPDQDHSTGAGAASITSPLPHGDGLKHLRCAVCGSRCTSQCANCHTPYCSKKCQKLEWPYHKSLCYQLRGFLEPQTSDRELIGLYFPVQGLRPKMVQLTLIGNGEFVMQVVAVLPNEEQNARPKLVLGDDGSEGDWYKITDGGRNEPKTDRVIQAYWRADFLSDGSQPNLAIREWMDWKHRHDWRGPVLFVAETKNPKAAHMSLADLRIVRDFLQSAGNRHAGLMSPTWTFGRHGYQGAAGWIQKARDMIPPSVKAAKPSIVTRSEETINEKSVEIPQAAKSPQTELDKQSCTAEEVAREYIEHKSTQSGANQSQNSIECQKIAGNDKVKTRDIAPLKIQVEAKEDNLRESKSLKQELMEDPTSTNSITTAERGSVDPVSIAVGVEEKSVGDFYLMQDSGGKYEGCVESSCFIGAVSEKAQKRLMLAARTSKELEFICLFLGVSTVSLMHLFSPVNSKKEALRAYVLKIMDCFEIHRREAMELHPVEKESVEILRSALANGMDEEVNQIFELIIAATGTTAEKFWCEPDASKEDKK